MKNLKQLLALGLFLCLSISLLAQQGEKKISMEDIMLHRTFGQKSVHGLRSMNDGIHYTTLEAGGTKIVKYAYATGKEVATLLDLNELKSEELKSSFDYEFNADESRILLMTDLHHWHSGTNLPAALLCGHGLNDRVSIVRINFFAQIHTGPETGPFGYRGLLYQGTGRTVAPMRRLP